MVLLAVASVARNVCLRIATNPCAQGPAKAPLLSWQSAYNNIKMSPGQQILLVVLIIPGILSNAGCAAQFA